MSRLEGVERELTNDFLNKRRANCVDERILRFRRQMHAETV